MTSLSSYSIVNSLISLHNWKMQPRLMYHKLPRLYQLSPFKNIFMKTLLQTFFLKQNFSFYHSLDFGLVVGLCFSICHACVLLVFRRLSLGIIHTHKM